MTPEERKRREAAARIDRALLSRREMLRRMGLGVVTIGAAPAILAACGGEEEAAAPPPAEPAEPDRLPSPPRRPPPPAETGATGGARDARRGAARERPARLPVLGGVRRPGRGDGGVEGRERGRDPGELHRQPRRHPGQDRLGWRGGRRPDHVLPGLQAPLQRARHPPRDRRGEDAEPRRACTRSG